MSNVNVTAEGVEEARPAAAPDLLDGQLIGQLVDRARGHFPTEAAALKCVYMAVMSLDPTGAGRKRWITPWKPALQAFDIAFDGRLSAGRR